MIVPLEFFVPGIPRPQGSKSRGKNGGMRESSKYVKGWRRAVTDAARFYGLRKDQPRYPGAVVLEATFCMPRPAKHLLRGEVRPTAPRYPTGAPDVDKLLRAVQDSLTDAGAWRDDSCVVEVTGRKIYANGTPGVHLVIRAA